MTNPDLLIFGGAEDSQLHWLRDRAVFHGVNVRALLVQQGARPALAFDPLTTELTLDGAALRPRSVFVRQDVFRYLRTGKDRDRMEARSWKLLIDGWLLSHPEIRRVNRGFHMAEAMNKPFALALAARCGLSIPKTMVGSDLSEMREMADTGAIYKPVAGGDECRVLDPASVAQGAAATAAHIVQARLVSPEMRIFRIGEQFIAYRIESPSLDYRSARDQKISQVDPPESLVAGMRRLSDSVGLDFAAADFKTDPETGELLFLEINSNPMFAGFDARSDGALADIMLDFLVETSQAEPR